MPCVLCGHSAPTNRNVIISQPCVNSKNGSAFSLLSFFQPCGFHSIHSLVSIQRKIQKGRSGSPGLSLCAFPLFLVLGPPILAALASLQSDLLCDLRVLTAVGLLHPVRPPLSCTAVWKLPPGGNWGNRRKRSPPGLSFSPRVLLCLLSKVCKQCFHFLFYLFSSCVYQGGNSCCS